MDQRLLTFCSLLLVAVVAADNSFNKEELAAKIIFGLNRVRNRFFLSKLIRVTSIRAENSPRGTIAHLDAFIGSTDCTVSEMSKLNYQMQRCTLNEKKPAEFCKLKATEIDVIVVIEKMNCTNVPMAEATGR
ncbi:unnamed protein product [Soboliphyme baturini]|uniref:Cystatin domain-containing protein n=1 Tax=Soboliphyme baturini TaxID=241478 RepID=A0A183ISH7_9BILA|nr:unnamed protein product [Soboliphyme baturini]